MTVKIHPVSKNRRDIGEVILPIEKIKRARELSSCCVGVEAMLEADRGIDGFLTRSTARDAKRKEKNG